MQAHVDMDLSGASSPTQGGTPVAEIFPGDFRQQRILAKASAGEAPPATVAGIPTTSRAQAGALFRKNAVYQKRNCCSNCCLLSAPIVFCLLLLGIQLAVNRLILSGEDYSVSFNGSHYTSLPVFEECSGICI
jgi:hypothetical protein